MLIHYDAPTLLHWRRKNGLVFLEKSSEKALTRLGDCFGNTIKPNANMAYCTL